MKKNLIETYNDKNKYIKEKNNNREIRVIEIKGNEIKLEHAFFFVLPIKEIDERMKQLKYETIKNSLFISGEEFCDWYFNSLLGKDDKQYAEFIAKMCEYDELIIRHAQFLKGKNNTIEILKTILAAREFMQKTTAIFTSEEDFGI